jgi:3-dehydroquinate dehydratase/shikimate dehydrogenase
MNDEKICVSVCSATLIELFKDLERAEQVADVIEIRFDHIDPSELDLSGYGSISYALRNIFKGKKRTPWIATLRPREQGGVRDISFDERKRFWRSMPAVDFVDLEPDIPDTLIPDGSKCIRSFHDFEGSSADVEAIYVALAAKTADIIKIAVRAEGVTDALGVWKLLEIAASEGKRVVPIAMGEAGKWTRIIGLAHGAAFTYAALNDTAAAAPGQISAADLNNIYRVKKLDRETVCYGVIGDPVSSSLSPQMHNAAFASLDINAVFLPLSVRDLGQFIARMVRPDSREVDLNFGGFAVTMPHKKAIIGFLDHVDGSAARIGAVNTVEIRDGKLIGHNTDALGFIAPLKERFGDLKGARVAICGAGGAARACVHALQNESAFPVIFARDVGKAGQFGCEMGIEIKALDNADFAGFDILVNATPVGMTGMEGGLPLKDGRFGSVRFVYDLVTSQGDTALVAEAKMAGIDAIGGSEMLLAQGARQFEIWSGLPAPIDVMKKAIESKAFNE